MMNTRHPTPYLLWLCRLLCLSLGLALGIAAQADESRAQTQANIAPQLSQGQTSYTSANLPEAIPVKFEAKTQAKLSVELDGVLRKLSVEVGQKVKKGQTLATVSIAKIKLERRAKLLQANYARANHDNKARLNQQGLVSHDEVLEAVTQLHVLEVEAQKLQTIISQASLKAPFTGIVTEVLIHQHEWVKRGDHVVSLLNPETLIVKSDLPVTVALALTLGDKRQINIEELNTRVEVEVKALPPSTDERSNTMRVIWSVLAPPPRLVDGMKGHLAL